jgi:hypothetical protein
MRHNGSSKTKNFPKPTTLNSHPSTFPFLRTVRHLLPASSASFGISHAPKKQLTKPKIPLYYGRSLNMEPVDVTRKDVENYVKMKFFTELTLIKEKLSLFEKYTIAVFLTSKNQCLKPKKKILNPGMIIWNGKPSTENTTN